MEHPIHLLERQLAVSAKWPDHHDQLTRAIALLKAHESMCECGVMPNDGNAAIHDLERSLSTHREMLVAFQGTPKGEHHAKCIREIEEALAKLKTP